jgi:hypothetical protein
MTELWEVYDYQYSYSDEGYAERISWAWKVEVPTQLSNGMTGWTYVGFVKTERVNPQNGKEEFVETSWSNHTGDCGTEEMPEAGVRQILERHYGKKVGAIEIVWR